MKKRGIKADWGRIRFKNSIKRKRCKFTSVRSNLSKVIVIPSRTPIHFLQESCRSGTYQTLSARTLQESWISDKPVRFLQIRHFLQIQMFLARFLQSRHLLQDSWTDLARQCLKLERYFARKYLECTGNVKAIFSILNQEYVQIECKCLAYVVART